MNDIAFSWPAWLGTPSQAGLLVVIVVMLIKTWPIIQKQVFEAKFARQGRYAERIQFLEKELKRCHDECNEKIGRLNTTVEGMKDQRLAEQGAMMRAIVRMSGDPEVKRQLELLESMELGAKAAVKFVGGPVEDSSK